jgi:hypothetical protein
MGARTISAIAATTVLACGGGQGALPPQPTALAPDQATYYVFAVPALPDSALKLAKFALGTIDGTISLPQIKPKFTTISTHYTRPRHGGGQREVAIIAAVDRVPVDGPTPATFVELAAYALDMAQAQTAGQRRAGVPNTAVSSNAPALRRPIPLSQRDTVDWRSFEAVIEALMSVGGKRR